MDQIIPTLPPDMKAVVTRDQSEFIENSLHAIEEHLVLGGLFAAIIVFLFLWNIRTTIIAALAIPTSIIGAFAAICRAEGRPFGFPGGASWVWECVDTRLVADALVWGATSPNAAGETFNLTNGEVFEWRTLWPSFAETFGLEAAPDEPVSLARLLPEKADLWDRIVREHGLRPIAMADLVGESHHYADFCFALGATEAPPAAFVSTVKIKQAGFGGVWDTEESFRHWHQDLIDRKVVPGPS
jgi:hypothetical protein